MDITERDQLLRNWIAKKAELETVKNSEMELRKRVAEVLFPNPVKGTQRFQLDNQGTAIKLVYKLNHTLGDAEKINPETGAKIRKDDQVFEAQREMEALGETAGLLADRLIKWTPDLSVSEYEKLDCNDPIQAKLKEMIDKILTIKPAAPSLEFEEPKVK